MNNFKDEKEKKAFKKAVKIFDTEAKNILKEDEKNRPYGDISDEQLDFRWDNCISDFWLKGIKEDKVIEVDGYSFDVVQLIEPLKDLNSYCNSYPLLLEKYRIDKEQSKLDKDVLDVMNARTDIKPNKETFKT